MSQRFLIEVNTDMWDELPEQVRELIHMDSRTTTQPVRGMKIKYHRHHMDPCPVEEYRKGRLNQ